MRARLADAGLWPILSEVYGLHPWDIGRLTPRELADYEACAEAVFAQRKARR